MVPDDGKGSLVLRGRTFSRRDLEVIRKILESPGDAGRSVLSTRVCEALGWYQENGLPKARACRDVLLRLEHAGLVKLPPRQLPPRKRRRIPITSRTDPRLPFPIGPKDVDLQSFVQVKTDADSAIFAEYLERYHYLGYGVAVGPSVRYFVVVHHEPVACLAFSGAAWKVAPRDQWIAWTADERKRNLRYVVNNTRFLILPWINVKNLASRILALAARRVPEDWFERYAYRPYLFETFVHANRHAGTCYKAANWLYLGETQGRGKLDRYNEAALPRKALFIYPLIPQAASRLRSP